MANSALTCVRIRREILWNNAFRDITLIDYLMGKHTNWLDTDWATVKAEYPEAQVLISGQDFERPSSWPALGDVSDIVEEYGVEK